MRTIVICALTVSTARQRPPRSTSRPPSWSAFTAGGPTDILRIVEALDDRVLGLGTDASEHECLTATPVATTYTLPGGQTFTVKLQCLQDFPEGPVGGAGWVAFGFDQAAVAVPDAGPVEASEGNDFYVVDGQENGMGGAYRISAGKHPSVLQHQTLGRTGVLKRGRVSKRRLSL